MTVPGFPSRSTEALRGAMGRGLSGLCPAPWRPAYGAVTAPTAVKEDTLREFDLADYHW
jgi:hypothetical protein